MKKIIGILECGRPPEPIVTKWGNHSVLFKKFLGRDFFDYKQWAVFEGEFPGHIGEADGWLLTGSKFGVNEDHDWLPGLEQFVRDAYNADVPVYGVCFGHQLIAKALGGKVVTYQGGWALGRQEYFLKDGGKIAVNAYHQDQVAELPSDATVTASNDFCQYAALSYKGTAASIQPHPEFEPSYLEELASLHSAAFPPEIFEEAIRQTKLGESALTRDVIAQEMRQFFLRTMKIEESTV